MVALLSLCGARTSRMFVPWTRGDDKQTATHQDVFWKAPGGCIRSLSKLKNTPKALISGQKSTLISIKR